VWCRAILEKSRGRTEKGELGGSMGRYKAPEAGGVRVKKLFVRSRRRKSLKPRKGSEVVVVEEGGPDRGSGVPKMRKNLAEK